MKTVHLKLGWILLLFTGLQIIHGQITYDYYRNPGKIGSHDPVATAYFIKGFEFVMQWGAEDTDSAIVYMQKAIHEDKSYAIAYATLGHLLRYKGYNGSTVDMDSIERLARKAIALNPKLGDAYTLLSRVFDYKQDHQKSIEACKKAVEFESDHRETWIWLGIMYSRTPGKTDSAIYAFHKSLEVDPNFGQPHQKLGFLYMNDKHDYEKAAYHFRQMIRLYESYKPRDERMILGYCGLGESLLLDKKLDSAIDTLSYLLKICENKPILWVDNLHARAHTALMLCYQEKANAELNHLIEGNSKLQAKYPNDASISATILDKYLDLGLLLKNYNFTDSIEKLKAPLYANILNNKPNDDNLVVVINAKFVSFMEEKNYQAAITELNSYLTNYPNRKVLKKNIYYNITCCYAKLDQPKEALKYLELSIREGFDDFEWLKNDPDLASINKSPEFKKMLNGRTKK